MYLTLGHKQCIFIKLQILQLDNSWSINVFAHTAVMNNRFLDSVGSCNLHAEYVLHVVSNVYIPTGGWAL